MIIKDLWIITPTGLCVYHYKAQFSNYTIDAQLFGGFVAALATFATTLGDNKIELIKMGIDELHFTTLEKLIVASIMSGQGAEPIIVDTLLKYVGQKFTENYGTELAKPYFEWDMIAEPFSNSINFIVADQTIYESRKEYLIDDLVSKILSGEVPPKLLQWKITNLFLDSEMDVIQKVIEKLKQYETKIPTAIRDPLLLAGLQQALKSSVGLLANVIPREKSSLIVLSEDKETYPDLYQRLLAFNIFSIPAHSVENIQLIIDHWKDEMPYNVLYTGFTISEEIFDKLNNLKTNSKIIIWTSKIVVYLTKSIIRKGNVLVVKQFPILEELLSVL